MQLIFCPSSTASSSLLSPVTLPSYSSFINPMPHHRAAHLLYLLPIIHSIILTPFPRHLCPHTHTTKEKKKVAKNAADAAVEVQSSTASPLPLFPVTLSSYSSPINPMPRHRAAYLLPIIHSIILTPFSRHLALVLIIHQPHAQSPCSSSSVSSALHPQHHPHLLSPVTCALILIIHQQAAHQATKKAEEAADMAVEVQSSTASPLPLSPVTLSSYSSPFPRHPALILPTIFLFINSQRRRGKQPRRWGKRR